VASGVRTVRSSATPASSAPIATGIGHNGCRSTSNPRHRCSRSRSCSLRGRSQSRSRSPRASMRDLAPQVDMRLPVRPTARPTAKPTSQHLLKPTAKPTSRPLSRGYDFYEDHLSEEIDAFMEGKQSKIDYEGGECQQCVVRWRGKMGCNSP
jgi:hypothetical protein